MLTEAGKEAKRAQHLRNLQHLAVTRDLTQSLDREEKAANRDTRWQEHILYGGAPPTDEDEDMGMMVGGDINLNVQDPQQAALIAQHLLGQQQPPHAAPPPYQQPHADKQPWYIRHALPLGVAGAIASAGLGYTASKMNNPPVDAGQSIEAPARKILFDPGSFEVETVAPGSLTNPEGS